MSPPFDEIRKYINRQNEEQLRKPQSRQLQEQRHQAAVIRFAQVISQYSNVINQTLLEFGAACSGLSRNLTASEMEQNKFKPLSAFDLLASASIMDLGIRIIGDFDGNVVCFEVGRLIFYWQDEWDEEVSSFIVDTQLPPSATKKDLETALIKSYRITI